MLSIDHAACLQACSQHLMFTSALLLIHAAAGAGGAGWAYNRMNNPRAAAIAGGFSALYFLAGWVMLNVTCVREVG